MRRIPASLLIVSFLWINLPERMYAQLPGGINLTGTYSWLYTTHLNKFNGVSVALSKPVTRTIDLGVNVGFAATPEHITNGLSLTRFRNYPVAVEFTYTPFRTRQFEIYTHLTPGISFMRYRERPEERPQDTARKVSDYGFYLYTGFGGNYGISDRIRFLVEVGNTFFKLSTNRLDVNPRGLTVRTGCVFTIGKRKK